MKRAPRFEEAPTLVVISGPAASAERPEKGAWSVESGGASLAAPLEAAAPYSNLISALEEIVSVGPMMLPLTNWTKPARGVIRS